MRKFLAIVGAVGAIALVTQAPAATRSALNALGIRFVGHSSETYRMPGAFTVGGRVGDPRRYCDRRSHHFVPSHIGNLREITTCGSNAVLWYEDADGLVRNVIVKNVDRDLVVLEAQKSRVMSVKH